jgi:hypothetical protein
MPLHCAHCGGAVSPISITAEGASFSCPCGRTTYTQLAQGKLDIKVEVPPKEKD